MVSILGGTMYVFTSESVGIGHPDKVADQISDAIVDECLKQDKDSHVAVETLVTTQFAVIAGEVKTKAKVDFEEIARNVIKEIGYTDPELGFDYENVKILVKIHEQSEDIDLGVSKKERQGAGDQGMMFGYATNETEEFMPLPIILAHKLVLRENEVRKELQYMNPDCKSQVSVVYEDDKPKYIDTVVFSVHHKDVPVDKLKKDVIEKIIKPVCGDWINDKTRFLINPTGRFLKGGPAADTGLTGRKIIVDTYGGFGRHGGGAFSGKDASKVDRSAAYVARWIAKNLVATGYVDKVEVQLAYAIGYPEPVSIFLETFGTEKVDKDILIEAIKSVFGLSPAEIIDELELKNPIFLKTAFGGHFGRKAEGKFFTWERLNKAEELKNKIKELTN